jgi:hypothetical protein
MTADAPGSENADLKAKMREALERKQRNDSGVPGRQAHGKEKGHETHGPAGGKREFRRKSG